MMSGDGDDNHSCGVTTLMFRNVPRRYGNTTLLREIEFMVGQGSVDMVFLPWDSEERNMGNAFVDFVDCNFAMLALQTMRGICWRYSTASKAVKVIVACVQGLAENLVSSCTRHDAQRVPANPVYPLVILGGTQVIFYDALRMALAGEFGRTSLHGDESPQEPQEQRQTPQELKLGERQQQCHEQIQAHAPPVRAQMPVPLWQQQVARPTQRLASRGQGQALGPWRPPGEGAARVASSPAGPPGAAFLALKGRGSGMEARARTAEAAVERLVGVLGAPAEWHGRMAAAGIMAVAAGGDRTRKAAAENRAAVRQSIGYQKSQADVQAQLQELVRRLHATTIGVPSDICEGTSAWRF